MSRRYKRKPYKPIDPAKFKETRYLARLTQQQTANLLHVTPRTVALWERGQSGIPYAAYKLLRILTGYELPGAAWKGWSLRGDALISPEQRAFTAQYLGYQWLTFAMAKSWSDQMQRQRDEVAAARKRAAERPAGPLRLVKG